MKTKIQLLLLLILFGAATQAQILDKVINAAERGVERAVERKAEQKAGEATEDAIDGMTGKKKNKGKKKDKSGNKNSGGLEDNSGGGLEEEGDNQVAFKRGSRIIFDDNFTKDAVGDFPAKWNSTKGGEVKTLKGLPNKYLKVTAGSIVNPELTKSLPENFTVEFDLILPSAHPYRRAGIGFAKAPEPIDHTLASSNACNFDIMSAEMGNGYYSINYAEKSISYQRQDMKYKAPLDKIIKVAYEVNGKRIRMFVDGEKMVDLPTQFKPEYRKALYFNSITSGWLETEDAYFYIGNLIIAETGTDERSSVLKDLMEKGSFSTNAILFASGSDKIQAESNSILTQIKEALDQAPDMKIKIVGHTDSDGADATNLTLSQKRANAVKMKLVSMGVSANRFTTEGKGESEPISSNDTADGKSQNRRVEFIKQ